MTCAPPTTWPELRERLAFESAEPPEQLSRALHVTAFVTGWKRFSLVNVHLAPGDDSDEVLFRRDEMRLLLAALGEARDTAWTDNLILVGDMNLYSRKDDATVAHLAQAGYQEPPPLAGLTTNAAGTHAYDRMFLGSSDYFRLGSGSGRAAGGGVINLFEHVFRDEDQAYYRDDLVSDHGGNQDIAGDLDVFESYWRVHWRTRQVSDHLPIWVEIETDDSEAFLSSKRPA